MKERPILFSAPMVRAILAGTKTVTRRIVTPQQPKPSTMEPYELELTERDGSITAYTREQFAALSPYGQPGDRLWVKETWRIPRGFDKSSPSDVAEQCLEAGYPRAWSPIKYETDGEERMREMLPDFGGGWGKTRVSIHMPRWASRITLKVVSVRVERLHDIDDDDARREGVERDTAPCDHTRLSCDEVGCMGPTYRSTFAELWDSINGDRAPWASNPWVWRVEFKPMRGER